jgi:hypothetical protein
MSSTFTIKQKLGRKTIVSVATVAACLALLLAITARASATDTSSGSGSTQAAAVDAGDPFQWDLSEPGMPSVNKPYFFVNRRNDGILGYQSRYLGINLGWVSRNGPGNWTFSRANASDMQPIREGEAVALRNATGGYVYYGQRTWGINLNWSTTPRYEWTVSKQGGLFALHNEAIHDFVVYGRRAIGVNLCWAQDLTFGVCLPY